MKERPILFSAPMVRAILEGKKSQTRRVVPPMRVSVAGSVIGDCPYGYAGDRLWVRETWAIPPGSDNPTDVAFRADIPREAESDERFARRTMQAKASWSPSIHMPRAFSRIDLEITAVREERLQTISGADILAEGIVERAPDDRNLGRCPISRFDGKMYPDLVSLWVVAWDSINGERAPWSSNPWVWVVCFRVLEVRR